MAGALSASDRPTALNSGARMHKPTRKQLGDAGEMLVAAELTLAGVPALKVPDNWPGYDVVAQPPNGGPAQRVSVKTRTFKRGGDTFVLYQSTDDFDWLAAVLLPGDDEPRRRFFVVPRTLADEKAHRAGADVKRPNERWWSQQEFVRLFAAYENNFTLSATGRDLGDPATREISAEAKSSS